MSGHSKWAQIKRKKAVTDSRRGKLFTKILREITVAARLGGGDPAGNPRLRAAIQEARNSNVPNDNIERAVKKGTGELEGVTLEEVVYEGYGPGGVAILVEAVTDNKNRTVSEIRHLFSKHGGNLGENGCVSWMFEKRGVFSVPREALDEEEFMELALELGAEDFSVDENAYELLTSAESYLPTADVLRARGIEPSLAELTMIPQTETEVPSDQVAQVLRLLDALEDHDDTQNVWANLSGDLAAVAHDAR